MNSDNRVTPVRDAERTKRQILDATVRLLSTEGTGVTLARISKEAGVSKGGLLHHFENRDHLLYASLIDANNRFRDEVLGFLDLADNHPGKVLRAYVRALCGGSEFVMRAFSNSGLWTQLHSYEGAKAIFTNDAEQWEHDLAADGLDADVILVVRLAAEGAVGAWLIDGTFTDADLVRARERLIALTLPDSAGGPARLPQGVQS